MKRNRSLFFELKPKDRPISIRINNELLVLIKEQADKEGVSYQKWIRSHLELSLLGGWVFVS